MSAKALRVGRATALAVGIAVSLVAVLGATGGIDHYGAAVPPDRERRGAVDLHSGTSADFVDQAINYRSPCPHERRAAGTR